MTLLFMFFFFFNDTATTEIYTLSLHDALPISTWSTFPTRFRPADRRARRRPRAAKARAGCESARSRCRRRRARAASFPVGLSKPQVGLDDSRVGRNGVERPLGDLDAGVERDDAVRDSLYYVHVVLDDEDRVAALVSELADQPGDLVRLGRIHPGGPIG